jgi:hypothetical protein
MPKPGQFGDFFQGKPGLHQQALHATQLNPQLLLMRRTTQRFFKPAVETTALYSGRITPQCR